MRLPARLLKRLWSRVFVYTVTHVPTQVIGEPDDPYLERWCLFPKNPFGNIYLHKFHKSDDDRALHDHPWPSLSVGLNGHYVEHTIAEGGIESRVDRAPGEVVLRSPWLAHRIELRSHVAYTLFLVGPRVRDWGFHCPQAGWVLWTDFIAKTAQGNRIGKGCDQ